MYSNGKYPDFENIFIYKPEDKEKFLFNEDIVLLY